jgi:hypothetical protein
MSRILEDTLDPSISNSGLPQVSQQHDTAPRPSLYDTNVPRTLHSIICGTGELDDTRLFNWVAQVE